MAVQRGLPEAPALYLWLCGWSRTRGTEGVGVCADHDIFRVSSSTSSYLRLPPLQSGVPTQSLCCRITVGPLAFAVFMSSVDLHLLGGTLAARRQMSPKDSQGLREMVHVVHFPVLDSRVQAHQRSRQV